MKTIARVFLAMFAMATLFTLLLPAASAGAHAGTQAYMYLDVSANDLGGRVELPFDDVETVLGIDLGGTDEEALATLEANLDELQAYVLEHMALGADGQDWVVTFGGVKLLLPGAKININYAVLDFSVAVTSDNVPREIDVSFDPFFDEIDGRDALLCEIDDADCLAASMDRLLREPALCQRLVAAGRETVAAFGWGRVRGQWLDLYRRVASASE